MTTAAAAAIVLTNKEKKYDAVDLATYISEQVIEHANTECSHCLEILEKVRQKLDEEAGERIC
jgi:flagellin-specific chaperone FliS